MGKEAVYMKGRVLFALLFIALVALGISSLYDMQETAASLPLAQKATAYIAALPAPTPDTAEEDSPLTEKATLRQEVTACQPPAPLRCRSGAPLIDTSYYLAFYQAFHFSDRAG